LNEVFIDQQNADLTWNRHAGLDQGKERNLGHGLKPPTDCVQHVAEVLLCAQVKVAPQGKSWRIDDRALDSLEQVHLLCDILVLEANEPYVAFAKASLGYLRRSQG
jgi:hypothetical protein